MRYLIVIPPITKIDNIEIMKNLKFKVLCFITLGSLFCGCTLFQQTSNTTDGTYNTTNEKGEQWLSLKCFQTLGNADEYSCCLARNDNWDVFYIVNFTCPTRKKTEVYYDSKTLNGKYVFVGTYTYESKEGSKTVRAYMPKDNFSEWCDYDKNTLIGLLDIVLSYNSIK